MSFDSPSLAQRQSEQAMPDQFPIMLQRWSDLAFIHWPVSPQDIQASLPERLRVDTFDSQAWIGLVPFFMERIRPRFLPPLPGLSWFLEMNVRTYVFDRETGRPGVWFYSLDCNQNIAVKIARRFFLLPYFHAEMKAEQETHEIRYHCKRKVQGVVDYPIRYQKAPLADCRTAIPGTLEFFLLERYLLYSSKPDGSLYCGQVNHSPYHFSESQIDSPFHPALEQAGFPQTQAPESILFSPGVDVCIFPLRRLK